jgi:hypothetical protein
MNIYIKYILLLRDLDLRAVAALKHLCVRRCFYAAVGWSFIARTASGRFLYRWSASKTSSSASQYGCGRLRRSVSPVHTIRYNSIALTASASSVNVPRWSAVALEPASDESRVHANLTLRSRTRFLARIAQFGFSIFHPRGILGRQHHTFPRCRQYRISCRPYWNRDMASNHNLKRPRDDESSAEDESLHPSSRPRPSSHMPMPDNDPSPDWLCKLLDLDVDII